ncbi:MAG: ChaN family lipoprotein, partial [Planctomycetota bacterium]|nr:ChaN family lipoprotein [Planctomycetota bacterium]
PGWRALATEDGGEVDLAAMADALAGRDVVFLGEEHDNGIGHGLQLELTKLLAARREVVVSLEMFERDGQEALNLYLWGTIDETEFLERSRPWKNYAEHYRGVIEFAKAEGLHVVAANCYRPLASRVSKEGRWSVHGEPWAAQQVNAGPGAYRDKFVAAMGDHAADMGSQLDQFFESQCIKDDTMAESIARVFAGEQRPLVVHWNGRFHSDEGLGTVERLLARVPDLSIGIVTMISGDNRRRELTDAERGLADYVWLVPATR